MSDIVGKLRDAREKTELMLLKQELQEEHRKLKKLRENLLEKENSLDEHAKFEARDVEYHSQGYAAFFGTRMEKDKSILTLSVVGIGYLATFSKIGDEPLSGVELYLFFLAAASFLTAIIVVIQVFQTNGDFIKSLLSPRPEIQQLAEPLNKKLKRSDKIVVFSFILGIITTILMGYIASNI